MDQAKALVERVVQKKHRKSATTAERLVQSCHLAEHNHSEHFYRLLHQVMPAWETIKARLDAKAVWYALA